jgi:hypothetical protein
MVFDTAERRSSPIVVRSAWVTWDPVGDHDLGAGAAPTSQTGSVVFSWSIMTSKWTTWLL